MLGLAYVGYGQGRDTAFAVRKLFREKRGNAQNLKSFRDSTVSQTMADERAGRIRSAQDARRDALTNTAFTIAGTLKASNYSPENEAAVLRQYREGGSIPPDIRRKLRRKHFHVTARDVVAH